VIVPKASSHLSQLGHPVVLSYGLAMFLINLVGALTAYGFLRFVIPLPSAVEAPEILARTSVVFLVGTLAMSSTGMALGMRDIQPVLRWLARRGAPKQEENDALVREPARRLFAQAALWAAATVLMSGINITTGSAEFVLIIIVVWSLTGASVCTIAYFIGERILRPLTTKAMVTYLPGERTAPGVGARIGLVWGLTTGIPVLGLILLSGAQLTGRALPVSEQINVAVLLLALIAIVVGLSALIVAARSISDPLKQVAHAMQVVESGRLDWRVPVYDGSEIGQLQAGFNRMVHGLRERERLSDLFSQHVGEEVARQAIEHGNTRGGELREVAVVFIDLVGSTRLASAQAPDVVVALLNEFFAIVVTAIHRHGGTVSKFEGDAAVAIFGAPMDMPDAAGAALAAAQDLRTILSERTQLDFGIGVAAGTALAGNIGA
jgi:adenylate cyclase